MEIEEAIKICEDFIEENKDRKIILHTAIQTIIENSIPKKKIKDKIEELDKSIEKTDKLQPSATRYDTLQKLEYQAEVLQKLLEE